MARPGGSVRGYLGPSAEARTSDDPVSDVHHRQRNSSGTGNGDDDLRPKVGLPHAFARTTTIVLTLTLSATLASWAKPAREAQAEDITTWSAAKLYAHGSSLVRKGIQLNEAIEVLRVSAEREPKRFEYRLALASALASRFASIATAQQHADYETPARRKIEKQRIADWDAAQSDRSNPLFGSPRPDEPPLVRTPDDGKPFLMNSDETRRALQKLGRQSLTAYNESRKLAEGATPREQCEVEFERGWGLFLLRRFGKAFTPDERLTFAPFSKSDSLLEVRHSDVIESFTRCAALQPKDAANWQALGLAHAAMTILAIEYHSLQKSSSDAAGTDSRSEDGAIAAFKKALAIKPRDFDLLYQAAQVSTEADPAFAIDCLDRATQRSSSNAVLWYYLADQRFKRAPSRNEKDALNMNLRAVSDVRSGNDAPLYASIPIVFPAPPQLKRAWDYVTVFGAAEDHTIVEEILFALREVANFSDSQGDFDRFLDVITAKIELGLKAIGSRTGDDLNDSDPRTRTIRWGRGFDGVICSLDAFSQVRKSQAARPDDRKTAFLEAHQDLYDKLQALEKVVLKGP